MLAIEKLKTGMGTADTIYREANMGMGTADTSYREAKNGYGDCRY